MADSSNGELREFKKMRVWVDKNSSYKSIILYPRWFYIVAGDLPKHWAWNCYKETSDIDNIEVVKVLDMCWLNVRGQFKMSELSSGVVYEIAYMVKLTNGGYGWELPITLLIKLPDGKEMKRRYSLLDEPKEQWIELVGGSFEAKEGEAGEVCFDLYEHGGHWKSGLIFKGIIIRPKH